MLIKVAASRTFPFNINLSFFFTALESIKSNISFNDFTFISFKTLFTNDSLGLASTPDNSIYFVDEASMVSDIEDNDEDVKFGSGRLLKDLISFANCKDSHRKIVLIGDYAQLPPVGQNFSPALSEEYLQTAMLTSVIRQAADSGIYKSADAIRKSIDAKLYKQFGLVNSTDVIPFTSEEFISRYNEAKIMDGEDEVMVIAPSNAQEMGGTLSV